MVADAESGQVVDLLPDREAATLEEWLKARPGAEVICRDRWSWDRKGVSASLSGIVRDLNKRGVPTVHGGPWRVNTLKGILMSPATAGIATYKGEVTKVGAWPGILTVDQHHQVVKILGDPARRAWYTTDNPGDGRGRPPDYLLSGRVDGQQLFTCGRVLDEKDTANYPHLFADRVGEVCRGPVASAGSEKGGARTYGCRHCHRNSRLAAPVEMLVDTIMRFWLAHRDELQARVAQIGATGTWLKVPLGKLATERMVPLDAATLAALDEWAQQRGTHRPIPHPRTGALTDFLFTAHGRRLGASRLRNGLLAAAEAAGLRAPDGQALTVTCHQLRHTWATALQRRDEPASPHDTTRARHTADDHPVRHAGLPNPARRLRPGDGQDATAVHPQPGRQTDHPRQGQLAEQRNAQDPRRARLLLPPPGRRRLPVCQHLLL